MQTQFEQAHMEAVTVAETAEARAFSEAKWIGSPNTTVAAVDDPVMGIVGSASGLALYALVISGHAHAHDRALMLFFGAEAAMLFFLGLATNRATRGHVEHAPAAEDLLEDLDDPCACVASIRIWQNGVVTGLDHGVLLFDGACLVYSGRCTSFRIAPQDVYRAFALGSDTMTASGDGFSLRHPSRRVCITIQPLTRAGDKDIGPRIRFMKQFRQWRLGRESSSEQSQYPPLSVGPMIGIPPKTQRWDYLIAAAFGVATCVAPLLVGAVTRELLIAATAAIGVSLTAALFWAMSHRHETRTNHKLLRIMHEEGQFDRLRELSLESESDR